MTLTEQYLLGFENTELLDPGLVEMILDAFNKNYKEISDFFNYGEIRPVTYVVDPDYDGVSALCIQPGLYSALRPPWLDHLSSFGHLLESL